MAQAIQEAKWNAVDKLLPQELWEIVGEYSDDIERVQLLEPVLSEASKSVAFREKVAAERDRNLRLFLTSVLHAQCRSYGSSARRPFYMRLQECLEEGLYKPQAIGAEEYSLLTKSVALKECPADATGDLIKRVLHIPPPAHLFADPTPGYLFSRVEALHYHPSSSLVVKEIAVLKNLKHLTFWNAKALSGTLDLTRFSSLEVVDVRCSSLRLNDLLTHRRVIACSDEKPTVQILGPSPSCWTQLTRGRQSDFNELVEFQNYMTKVVDPDRNSSKCHHELAFSCLASRGQLQELPHR